MFACIPVCDMKLKAFYSKESKYRANHQLSRGFNKMVKYSTKELLTKESSAATNINKASRYLKTFDPNLAFRSQSAMHFNNINTQTVS